MAQRTEFWVDRTDFRTTKTVRDEIPNPASGEILVAIDKFGLTANNVSYAVSGDMIGYWQYYPAQGEWGKVPVWGCADVIASQCDELPVGERLWGFFPMASHTVLQPGRIKADQFTDIAAHRKELPALYNTYRRTRAEPEVVQGMETERCLLFPLFATSFILYDYLVYNKLFGAGQVLIGSVSSKTGFGLARLLQDEPEISAKVVGLTSPGNREFVEGLACCDQIVLYGEESQVDAGQPAAYVDMSGDGRLTAALHHHLGENMVESCMVGATHWENREDARDLPGARPTFFFAPAHIATREKEWGPGVPMMKAMEATVRIAADIQELITVDWIHGAADLESTWLDMLDNKVPPSRGLMVSLLQRSS